MHVLLTIANADRTVAVQGARMSTGTGEDGRFRFGRVPPGSYTISARALPNNASHEAMFADTNLWGETGVVVSGDDISGIAVGLQPTLSIAGRIVFENSGGPPSGLFMRLPLQASSVGDTSARLPAVAVNGATFSMSGIVPGSYRFAVPPRGIRQPIGRWWLKSVIVNRRELLDSELELRENSDTGVITFSDEASEISGVVGSADGMPVTDTYVVIFAPQTSAWFHGSRRVAGVRTASDGRYVVRNLPAGDYLIAAADDIEANEWFDPQVLQALVSTAAKTSLGPNEARVQDIAVRR